MCRALEVYPEHLFICWHAWLPRDGKYRCILSHFMRIQEVEGELRIICSHFFSDFWLPELLGPPFDLAINFLRDHNWLSLTRLCVWLRQRPPCRAFVACAQPVPHGTRSLNFFTFDGSLLASVSHPKCFQTSECQLFQGRGDMLDMSYSLNI